MKVRRVHRLAGLAGAPLLVFLAGTGLLLNHSDAWTALQQPLPAGWTHLFYGIEQQVAELTWERLLLDLHAGRFFGSLRPWLMDTAAIVVLVLAGSGYATVFWRR